MSKKLEGKIALITGGSRGIGLQSPSVWLRTERTWPSHTRKVPMRLRRSSRRSKALAEGDRNSGGRR